MWRGRCAWRRASFWILLQRCGVRTLRLASELLLDPTWAMWRRGRGLGAALAPGIFLSDVARGRCAWRRAFFLVLRQRCGVRTMRLALHLLLDPDWAMWRGGRGLGAALAPGIFLSDVARGRCAWRRAFFLVLLKRCGVRALRLASHLLLAPTWAMWRGGRGLGAALAPGIFLSGVARGRCAWCRAFFLFLLQRCGVRTFALASHLLLGLTWTMCRGGHGLAPRLFQESS